MCKLLASGIAELIWRLGTRWTAVGSNPDGGRDFPNPFRTTVVSTQTLIRGEFRPRQTRQLPRAVDLKGRLLSCQSY